MKGDELLRSVHAISPNTLKIMLTGQADLEAVANAINYAKLYRYIAKPWQSDDLKLTVTEAIYRYFQDKQLAEKQIKEFGDKIPADKRGPIDAALEKLKEAHKSQDVAQIDTAVTEMNAAWATASEDMYKASQGDAAQGQPGAEEQAGAEAGSDNNAGGENVTDAEFEEVK